MKSLLGARRPGLAVITPLPPAETGIAAYSARLLAAIATTRELRAYADGGAGASAPDECAGLDVLPLGALGRRERRRLYVFGNSPFHTGALRSLTSLGGDVLLHEVALWGVYVGLEREGVLPPGGARERVAALEGRTLEETIPLPCSMVAEVVARARRILVHTDQARRDLAARHPGRADDVRVVSFGHPEPSPLPAPQGDPVVASFGHQRTAELVVEAFPAIVAAIPSARLWLVGAEFSAGQMEGLVELLASAGLADRVIATGWLDADRYRERIAATAVAIQPRLRSYGERSAALGDLLCAGIPTVTHASAHADGIPGDAIARVPEGAGAGELASATVALLREPARRLAMRDAALRYAAAHSFERAAREVLEALDA
jgi:glycosyltransferase involved in cell wall biosynthesis